MGKPDLDSTDHSLRKQAGLRLSSERHVWDTQSEKEQELSRLKTTTPLRVFRVLYAAFGMALLLL